MVCFRARLFLVSLCRYTVPNGTASASITGTRSSVAASISTTSEALATAFGTSGPDSTPSSSAGLALQSDSGGDAGPGTTKQGTPSNAGVVAGTVIGALAFALLVILGIWWLSRRAPSEFPPPIILWQPAVAANKPRSRTRRPHVAATPPGFTITINPARESPSSALRSAPHSQQSPPRGEDQSIHNALWHANAAAMVQKARTKLAEGSVI